MRRETNAAPAGRMAAKGALSTWVRSSGASGSEPVCRMAAARSNGRPTVTWGGAATSRRKATTSSTAG